MAELETAQDRGLASWLFVNRQRVAELTLDARAARAPLSVEGRWEALLESTKHRVDCLRAAVLTRSPALFLDDIAWSKVVLAGHGLGDHELLESLDALREVLAGALEGPQRDVAARLLDEAIQDLPALPSDLDRPCPGSSPHADLRRRYFDALLTADHRGASEMILAAIERGTPVSAIYLEVIKPAQHESGRLWQTNRISVAQEHYCTAVSQQILARLHPWVFGAARIGRRVVVGAVAGELHEIGARMLADLFEMDGWDAYFLGASTPLPDLLATIVEQRADLVAVSATMIPHVIAVIDLVRGLRSSPQTTSVPILVGGHPFDLAPDLWKIVGADGGGSSPIEAVKLGRALVEDRDVH